MSYLISPIYVFMFPLSVTEDTLLIFFFIFRNFFFTSHLIQTTLSFMIY